MQLEVSRSRGFFHLKKVVHILFLCFILPAPALVWVSSPCSVLPAEAVTVRLNTHGCREKQQLRDSKPLRYVEHNHFRSTNTRMDEEDPDC